MKVWGAAVLVILAAGTALLPGRSAISAQGSSISFRVRETMGIQRTLYPVGARIPLPKGRLTDPSQARLLTNGAVVPAQFTATAAWDDGSVQSLDVDFNASLDPEEERRYQLQVGAAPSQAPAPRGLSVTDQPDAIQVGQVKFSKTGSPLLVSAAYRGEGIGRGRNGVTVTDAAGKRRELSGARNPRLEVVKPGPLLVVLRYSATLPIDDSYSVAVDILLEMPNSKSWVKMTANVRDPARRLRDVALETPLAFEGYPWLWDFGTDSGTYGVFRTGTDSVLLTQTVGAGGANRWTIATTTTLQPTQQQPAPQPASQRRSYEISAGSRVKTAGGWGHFQDAKAAVAFAVDGFGRATGTYTIALDGQGQATFRLAPAEPGAQHQLTVYEHFVPTPVAVGAATNPVSMLNPPVVVLER